MRLAPDEGNPYWKKAKFHSRILLGLVVFQGLNVAVQCYALAFALVSLADHTNQLHPPVTSRTGGLWCGGACPNGDCGWRV
jgi:hypothetical protein